MQQESGPYWRGLAGMSLRRLGHLPVTQVTALAAFGLLSFKGRFQVMHTQKQHWLDYDPVALAVLVIGMVGLLALTI